MRNIRGARYRSIRLNSDRAPPSPRPNGQGPVVEHGLLRRQIELRVITRWPKGDLRIAQSAGAKAGPSRWRLLTSDGKFYQNRRCTGRARNSQALAHVAHTV